jgi:hypothetical protein
MIGAFAKRRNVYLEIKEEQLRRAVCTRGTHTAQLSRVKCGPAPSNVAGAFTAHSLPLLVSLQDQDSAATGVVRII